MATVVDPFTALNGLGINQRPEDLDASHGGPSLLESLADDITQNAKIIADFLRSVKVPQPSFDRDAPLAALPAEAGDKVRAARSRLMESSLQAFQLALGPREYIANLAVGVQHLAALRWLIHFDVFHLVPLNDSIPYSALSKAAAISERKLKTVMRMAMTNNLFAEPRPNHVVHTATSAMLATNQSLHDWATFLTETTAPTANKLVEASTKWPASTSNTETAYNITFDTPLPFFDHLATQPEKTTQFASYMRNVQQGGGTALSHLIQAHDWAGLGAGTVVDVGGSSGATSIALAAEFPRLRFEVQDLADNVVTGRRAVAGLGDASVADRVTFRAHDFFDPQPVRGAAVYLLRMILHDWADAEAGRILQRLVDVIKGQPGARILVFDTLLPRPGSIPAVEEALLRARDMTMLQAFNSLERDLEDWERLFAGTSPALRLRRVQKPEGSVMTLLELGLNEG